MHNAVKKYVDDIKQGNAAVFVGAGLSCYAGYVDWGSLLNDVAKELKFDIEKGDDLISIAQYYCNHRSKQELIQMVIDKIGDCKKPSETHNILANLPIDVFWTTNYDHLIEDALAACGKKYDIKRKDNDLSYHHKCTEVIIYKIHGDMNDASNIIISKNDYEMYESTHRGMLNVLKGDLTTKSFLFLGYSFRDPNLIDVLARIRGIMGDDAKNHFALMRKPSKEDFETDTSFWYKINKRELEIEDFKRYNISVVEFDNYEDTKNILKRISKQVNKTNIFISAALQHEKIGKYGMDFLRKLISRIYEIKPEIQIYSGYGKNVGPTLVDSCLFYLDQHPEMGFEEKLKLFPFSKGTMDRWKSYREMMMKRIGICIFAYGTKEENGKIINSSGMLEEYEIAKNNGCLIIPIGVTGGAALSIADDMFKNSEGADKDFIRYVSNTGNSEENIIEEVVKYISNYLEIT